MERKQRGGGVQRGSSIALVAVVALMGSGAPAQTLPGTDLSGASVELDDLSRQSNAIDWLTSLPIPPAVPFHLELREPDVVAGTLSCGTAGCEYILDDGSADGSVPSGGANWIKIVNYFDVAGGCEKICGIRVMWGPAPPGSPARFWVYGEPTGTGDIDSAVLKAGPIIVATANENTGMFTDYTLPTPVNVRGGLFVAVAALADDSAGQNPILLDSTAPVGAHNRGSLSPEVPDSPLLSPLIPFDAFIRALSGPNQDPVADCRDVTVNLPPGQCTATVQPSQVNDDSFDPDPTDTLTYSLSPAGPYPIGQTAVTLTADDGAATDFCGAIIRINDVTPPTTAVTITNDPQPIAADASCNATATFEILVTDDCCVNAANLDLSLTDSTSGVFSNHGPGNFAPEQISPTQAKVIGSDTVELSGCSGTVTIRASARDCSGNLSPSGEDTVTVRDNTDPNFAPLSFPDLCWEDASDFESAARQHLESRAFDNCDDFLSIITVDSDTVCDAALRLALRDDCDNESNPAVFTGKVDGIEPRIDDPEPIDACYASAEEAIAAAKTAAEEATTDNCEGDLEFLHFLDQLGCRAIIDVRAEDECENISERANFFTTIDAFPPTSTCFVTTPQPVEVDANCDATIEFRCEINDNCCIDPSSLQVLIEPRGGAAAIDFDQFADCEIDFTSIELGRVELACRATVLTITQCEALIDLSVAAADCCDMAVAQPGTATVTVVDTTPPVIECPDPVRLGRGDKICSSEVQEWLNSATITDNCDRGSLITNAPECGFPYGGTTTVTFTADDGCENDISCTSEITIGPAPRVDISQKGSLLAFSKIDLRWDAAGALTQDTFLTLTNDYPEDVYVQMYFVNGDELLDPILSNTQPPVLLSEGEPGWNWVDCQLLLTPDQPIYWSASTGNPAGCQPFSILDPDLGGGAGRPAPGANDGSRALRGFVLAFAVNQAGSEIHWNHLSGKATIVDYANTTAWEYDAFAFQAGCRAQGDELADCTLYDEQGVCCLGEVIPGALGADGFQYDYAFDALLLDFFAVGSMALSGPATSVTADTDLTLHIPSADLRQETGGPVTTKAHFDIWNSNERKLSNTRRCLTCWDQTLLSQYGAPNSFLLENMQTDKGKARIDGKLADECEENCFRDEGGEPLAIEELLELAGNLFDPAAFRCSQDAALLGLVAKYLGFGGAGQREIAGSNLVGMGVERALIQHDVINPPGTLRMDAYNRIGPDAGRAGERLHPRGTPKR